MPSGNPALRRWVDTGRLKRKELFVASKLPIMGMEPCLVEFYVDMSLRNLGLDYFDLYLIHTPFGIERDDASGGFKMVDGKVGRCRLFPHFPSVFPISRWRRRHYAPSE